MFLLLLHNHCHFCLNLDVIFGKLQKVKKVNKNKLIK